MCDKAHSSHISSVHVARCYLTPMHMQQVERIPFGSSLIDTVSVLYGTSLFVRQNTTCFMWGKAKWNLQLMKYQIKLINVYFLELYILKQHTTPHCVFASFFQVKTTFQIIPSVLYNYLNIVHLSIYGSTVLLFDLSRIFSLLILYTTGRTPWTENQPVARTLPTYLLMELSPSWEAANCAAIQKIPSNFKEPEGSSPCS
jgi:hypothetical protein